MRDLFACPTLSEGTLANFSAACSRQLEPVDKFIRDLLDRFRDHTESSLAFMRDFDVPCMPTLDNS